METNNAPTEFYRLNDAVDGPAPTPVNLAGNKTDKRPSITGNNVNDTTWRNTRWSCAVLRE